MFLLVNNQWPIKFFDFSPIEDVPDFKTLRSDLSEITNEALEIYTLFKENNMTEEKNKQTIDNRPNILVI